MTAKTQADASGVLRFLFDKFDKESATDEELHFLSFASDEASAIAQSLGTAVAGIGCLVAHDQNAEAGILKSGALQSYDLPALLFNIGDALKTISELSFIGSEASFHQLERLKANGNNKSRRARPAEDSSRDGI